MTTFLDSVTKPYFKERMDAYSENNMHPLQG